MKKKGYGSHAGGNGTKKNLQFVGVNAMKLLQAKTQVVKTAHQVGTQRVTQREELVVWSPHRSKREVEARELHVRPLCRRHEKTMTCRNLGQKQHLALSTRLTDANPLKISLLPASCSASTSPK